MKDRIVAHGTRHPRVAVIAVHVLLPLYLIAYGWEGLREGWRLFLADRRSFVDGARDVVEFRGRAREKP